MKTRQIHAWFGSQGAQLRDEVQRLEYDVRSAVAVRCLKLVANVSVRGQRQTLLRHRRSGYVTTQPL